MSEETPTPSHSFPMSPAKDRESELQLRTCRPVPGLTPTGESSFPRAQEMPGWHSWPVTSSSTPPDVPRPPATPSLPLRAESKALSVVPAPTAPTSPECLSETENADLCARPMVSVCLGWCYKIPLGALKSRGVSSHALEARSSRPRCQLGCFSLRPLRSA